MRYFLIFITLLLASCKNDSKPPIAKNLTEHEQKQINNFVADLTSAINNNDYAFLNNAWSHIHFRRKVTNLTSAERTVFNAIYESDLSSNIDDANINIINRLRYSDGKLSHIKTEFIEGHAEVTYLLQFINHFNFWRYRIDLQNNQAKLTDIYFVKEEKWLSKSMKEMMKVNSRYQAMSPERHEANRNAMNFQKALAKGDTLEAFMYLNSIPKSHQLTNDFRITKINLAAKISESLLLEVIDQEKKGNSSLYIDYLIGLYTVDSSSLAISQVEMLRKIGIQEELLDSLQSKGLIWY